MTVGNILSTSAFLLGDEKLSNKIDQHLKDDTPFSKEEKEEVDKLLKCYNITIQELSEEYLPLTFTEELKSDTNKFYYKDFKKVPIEIKSVYRSVIPLNFKVFPTYFVTDGNTCTVKYCYLYMPKTDLKEHCEYENSLITKRIIAEGVVSEMLLNKGMFEQALLWRDRYTKSLQNALLKRKIKKVKARGWY